MKRKKPIVKQDIKEVSFEQNLSNVKVQFGYDAPDSLQNLLGGRAEVTFKLEKGMFSELVIKEKTTGKVFKIFTEPELNIKEEA